MRTIFVLFVLSAALLACQDVKVEEVGNSPVEAKFAPGGQVRLDLCPAGVELIGRDDSMLRVSYTPEREGVRVRIRTSGDRADVELRGCPHNNFKVKIEVPKLSALYVRMMAGQLDGFDVKGDKDVELSFGQLNYLTHQLLVKRVKTFNYNTKKGSICRTHLNLSTTIYLIL